MPLHSSTCSSATSLTFTSLANGETPLTFSSIPSDIIDAHILTKLDGPTLASAACVSSQLRALCLKENLWINICNTTWPSITHPLVRDVISTFPSGFRSFFTSNSFPTTLLFHHRLSDPSPPPATRELISAVDIRYKNKVVYSNIQVTNTLTEGFLLWPICVELINVRDSPVKFTVDHEEEELLSHVLEQVNLSWIMIDPTRKGAVNLSSIRPVFIEPLYLNGAYKRIRYSTLMVCSSESNSDTTTAVEFQIVVTCGGMLVGGELVVREVNLQVVNVDGVPLNGKDGLVILQKAMESDRRSDQNGKGREGVYLRRSKRKEKELGKVDVELRVGDYACILVLSVAFTGWILWFCFRRFILRRNQM